MAKATSKSETKVTRIKATDSGSTATKASKIAAPKAKKPKATLKKADAIEKSESAKRPNLFIRFWRYIKGSWSELRQVRWPDRKATWGMTGALITFTVFFILVIVVLDYAFSELFKLIMGN